jgi:hypothetical protein
MRRRVWLLLVPEHRFGRPGAVVTALEWVRTLAALGVVYVSVSYTGLDFEGALQRFVLGPMVNAGLALPALLIGMTVIVVAARDRRVALRALGRPVVTAIAAVAVVAAFAWITYTMGHRMGQGYWGLYLLVMVPVGLPALGLMAFLVLRCWFRAADGHPMLPALCALGYAVTQVVVVAVYGPGDTLPAPWDVVVGVGSPLSLAAVAGVELALLRNRRGVSIRRLPPLVPPPPPPPVRWDYSSRA